MLNNPVAARSSEGSGTGASVRGPGLRRYRHRRVRHHRDRRRYDGDHRVRRSWRASAARRAPLPRRRIPRWLRTIGTRMWTRGSLPNPQSPSPSPAPTRCPHSSPLRPLPMPAWRFEETTARQALLDAFFGRVARWLRLRRQAAAIRRRRAAAIPPRTPNETTSVRSRRCGRTAPRVYDARRGHAPQSGADREHPRRHGARLAARRAGRDADPDGRPGLLRRWLKQPLLERRRAQSAPRPCGGLACATRRCGLSCATPARASAIWNAGPTARPGHRPPTPN